MLEANTGVTDTGITAASPSAAPTEPSAAPSQSTETAPSTQPTQDAPLFSEDGAPQPNPFQPDWKFKVKDKEFEIEEWARNGVKDEETYKKLKRVWERHQGLDEVVQSRDQIKQQFEGVQPTLKEYSQVVKSLNEISHYYNSGDMDGFFHKLQIPFEAVLQYVKSKHQLSQLPPEVQSELEKARQESREAYNYKNQLQEMQESQTQIETQQKLDYINNVITSQAGDIAQRFNEANGGNPDAFRNFLIFKGQELSRQMGRTATPEETVQRCKEDLMRLMGPTPAQPQATNQPVAQAAPPVIPNIKAGSQSPVRQPPKSLDDIRKIAKSM